MSITWQDAATAGIVLAALGYVTRCLVRVMRRKSLPNCGCCPKCPAEPSKEPLVGLDEQPKE